MMKYSGGLFGPVFVMLAVAAGCGDGTGARSPGASVQILVADIPFEEQTIEVGQTVKLDAQVRDEGRRRMTGETVTWRSDDPDVATVNSTGLVTGKAVGTARIVASHPSAEATATFNVAQGFSLDELPGCAAGEGIVLEVGEATVVAGAEALPLCLAAPADAGAEYTMVAANVAFTSGAVLQVLVDGDGHFVPGGSTNRIFPAEAIATARGDERFHERLRSGVSARLESRLRQGVDPSAFTRPSAQLVPNQSITFNAASVSGDGCSNPQPRQGSIRYVGDHAVAVADTKNPDGGFTDAEYREFVEFFDEEVWPLVTGHFGDPSDIDSNQKVFVFFTRAVNELVENGQGRSSYVGGFFFNRDLFPVNSCAGSNAAEMFYMLVPDPQGEAGGRAFSKQFVARSTRNVLVHEFQHLVNDSRRLHVNDSPIWEESWLNEGLSHVAEEMMFYNQSGLTAGSNIGPESLKSDVARSAFQLFQLDNLERLKSFLMSPQNGSPVGEVSELASRGAAWSFLRYAADHRGGDEQAFWHALVRDSRMAGMENLAAALGSDPAERLQDWAGALYADDLVPGIEPRYALDSWNLRAIFPQAGSLGLGTFNQPYPLDVQQLRAWATPLQLQGGGAGYIQLVVARAQTVAVRYAQGSGPFLPPPSRLRVVVIRTG